MSDENDLEVMIKEAATQAQQTTQNLASLEDNYRTYKALKKRVSALEDALKEAKASATTHLQDVVVPLVQAYGEGGAAVTVDGRLKRLTVEQNLLSTEPKPPQRDKACALLQKHNAGDIVSDALTIVLYGSKGVTEKKIATLKTFLKDKNIEYQAIERTRALHINHVKAWAKEVLEQNHGVWPDNLPSIWSFCIRPTTTIKERVV